MTETPMDRAATVADLMKRSSRLGMAAEVQEDGSVWLHGPNGTSATRIGDAVLEAVCQLRRVELDPKSN